ncbi:MFS transporter [Pseudochryseolinea flava]|uniref:MFS transporter n=1 Tax=Pseudochryseolinea flava TaxID=2059302 RepID=A0A364XWD3_9BACT|nr:MFS transporter [Pseudochryseolinea flava]RAV98268.1 MFS transporter [Pseudochryseolinea flava]
MQRDDLKKLFSLPVVVAALGYFVDIYDLLLFGVVRVKSLKALGVPDEQLFEQGEYLLRIQMAGLLIGGILWGVMGDKRGRLSVLFGSILLYSLANFANGFVQTVDQYAVLRLIAGIGLAGELGAGITLVSETLPKHIRGYGTTVIASFGILGAVLAYFISEWQDWRVCYFIGGGMGLALLVTRVSVFESGIFLKAKTKDIQRGNFLQLFTNKTRLRKLTGCILIGLPLWYVIGILITFSPEFAKALSIEEPIKAGKAIMISYLGLTVGDLASGIISQRLHNRKKVVAAFITFTMLLIVLYLFLPIRTSTFFYAVCFILGIGIGYWALFVTIAAEQFGTNLRATVATSVPNFIRGTVIPLTLLFKFLRDLISGSSTDTMATNNGIIYGALIVGLLTIVIAYFSLTLIDETYGRDLNFEEEV